MGGRKIAVRLAGLLGVAAVCGWPAVASTDTWRQKVDPRLLSVYDSRPASGAVRNHEQVRPTAIGLHFDDQARVQVDIHYRCGAAVPLQALATAGLAAATSVRLTPFCVVEGWIAPASLAALAQLSGITRVATPSYALVPHRNVEWRPFAGPVSGIDHNGVTIMRADQFVSQTATSGGGVKVGVQSGGVSSAATIRSRGELPAVQVLRPSDGAALQVGDEGTALLEEIHAVAPGASLAYCGPHTFVEYTSCLSQLVNAGATILVDDVIFPEEDLLSSDSSQVQGIEQLLAANPNVALFTAVGNYNGSYWEGTYAPASLQSLSMAPLSCAAGGGQTDNYVAVFDGAPSQVLTVTQSSNVPVALAWSDPPNQNSSRFDLYWVGTAGSGCLPTASATDNQVTQTVTLNAGTYSLYIGTPDASENGKFVKLWIGGDGLTSISKGTGGSVVTPQAFANGSVTIGAVNGSDGAGNGIETFSSVGPISVQFPAAAKLQAPVLVAPDGINVDAAGTYFAGSLFPDGNFYGTSASAPNAGAVAALIRGAFPSLDADHLVSALKTGAVALGGSLPDAAFGYGRVDAIGALGTFPIPTITALPDSSVTAGNSTAAVPFTVSGFGPLHFTVTSSNTTSIPNSVVPAGSPGVTITPSDCGVSTLTCMLSVMPANGPGGTVSLTVAALDGANRSASSKMTVTVAGSAAPPPSSPTPATTPSGGGGGNLDWWLLGALVVFSGLRHRMRGRLVQADSDSTYLSWEAAGRFGADLAISTPMSASAKPANCTGESVSPKRM